MAEGSGRRSDYFRRHPVATTIAGACAAVALIIAAVLAVGVVGLLLGLRSLGRAGSSDPCDTADLKVVHLAARAEVHALDTWLDRHPRDVDRIDPNGTSALSCAAQRGKLPTVEHPPPSERIVDLLSEFTSRIRSTSPMDHRRAPTIRSDGARLGSDTLGTFNDQLEPFDPNRTVDAPPLAVAAAYQDAGLVRLLLTGGADPNRLALDGRSPIELAAMACDPKIVRMLAERGARVDASRHDVRAEACATVRPLLPAR